MTLVADYRGDSIIVQDDAPDAQDVRYVVVPDDAADDPRDWGWGGTHTVVACGHHYDSDEEPESPAYRMFAYWYDKHWTQGRERAVETAQRFARIFETGETVTLRTVRGYSQSDWWDVLSITTEGSGDVFETFEAYLIGDVYRVRKETRRAWHSGEDVMYTWEPQGHWYGGLYYRDPVEAVRDYLENED